MLIELSKLYNMPLGSFEEGQLLGKVIKVVVVPQDKKVAGFIIKAPGIFGRTFAISIDDIVEVDASGLVVNSSDCLVEPKEIVRFSEILAHNFELIGLRVKNKKKRIGRVEDAVVDSEAGDIMRLYVKSTFANRVFERSQISEINYREVVLKVDDEAVKVEGEPVPEVELA